MNGNYYGYMITRDFETSTGFSEGTFQKFKLSRVAILIASKHNINSKVKESEDSIVFDGSTSVATYVATSESKVKISN